MDFGFAHEPSQVVYVDFSVAFRVVNGPKNQLGLRSFAMSLTLEHWNAQGQVAKQ